ATRTAYSTKPKSLLESSEDWVPEGKPLLVDQLVEILKIVFESIDALQDAISLGLTCKGLLELGFNQINRLLKSFAAHWAGVLSPEEMAMITDDSDEDYNLYSYVEDNFEVVDRNRLSNLLQGDIDFTHRLSQVERQQYRTVVNMAGESPSASVLCNLSKREYLRQETIKAHGRAGFGTFLLARICWSWDPSVSMKYTGGIHRGIWAGDRFEITTIDAMKGGVTNWKDVSEEMGKEMATIWEIEFGSE
ncbi:hypothetical protein FRB94_012703, partial [Tulasnella sp. JGI-2019a]